MRLYERFMVPCIRYTVEKAKDSEGGQQETLRETGRFSAAITRSRADSSRAGVNGNRAADRRTVAGTVNVTSDMGLLFDDIISDGRRFYRVLAPSVRAPDCAAFDFFRTTAEVDTRWQ